jgi:Lrp/AsnC family leucine-responsive transcriptional regulator
MTLRNERVDEIDWAIIVALQENARLSMAALGREVGLSAPAATERVRRLEQQKIIRAYRLRGHPKPANEGHLKTGQRE